MTGDPLAGLTERQRQVLAVAHHGGYFEKPRAQNASEVAESLGVSRPAYDEVLRAASGICSTTCSARTSRLAASGPRGPGFRVSLRV